MIYNYGDILRLQLYDVRPVRWWIGVELTRSGGLCPCLLLFEFTRVYCEGTYALAHVLILELVEFAWFDARLIRFSKEDFE